MKTNFLFILFFISNFLFCQKTEYAIAVIQSFKKFNIYSSFSGNSIKYKIVNKNPDEYYDLKLIQKKGNRFFVKISGIYNQKERKGWVDIKNVEIGLRSSDINFVPIYSVPNFKSKKNNVKVHHESVIAKVLDFKDNWLKVSFYWNGKTTIGWLAPENQCENFYTMCTG